RRTLRCRPSFFFFQAEDGIRDFHVTGVQTCALPIYPWYDNLIYSGLTSMVIVWSYQGCFPGNGTMIIASTVVRRNTRTTLFSIKIGRASCRERMDVLLVAERYKERARTDSDGVARVG